VNEAAVVSQVTLCCCRAWQHSATASSSGRDRYEALGGKGYAFSGSIQPALTIGQEAEYLRGPCNQRSRTFSTDLFASAKAVKLAADQVLFLADDPGD
jgi:hypothetical protein